MEQQETRLSTKETQPHGNLSRDWKQLAKGRCQNLSSGGNVQADGVVGVQKAGKNPEDSWVSRTAAVASPQSGSSRCGIAGGCPEWIQLTHRTSITGKLHGPP